MNDRDHGFILESPLLTPDEAARRLKVSTRTIDDARRAGRIVGTLIGRQYRYTLADLDDYVARCREEHAEHDVDLLRAGDHIGIVRSRLQPIAGGEA